MELIVRYVNVPSLGRRTVVNFNNLRYYFQCTPLKCYYKYKIEINNLQRICVIIFILNWKSVYFLIINHFKVCNFYIVIVAI